MRRVRLKTVKGARLYTLSLKRRIQLLNNMRLHRHAINLLPRRSSRKQVHHVPAIPQRILNSDESGLQIHNFGETKGRGIVASRPFMKHEAIIEYCGELLSHEEGLLREQNYPEDVGSYMYYFTYKGRAYCIDASEETSHLGRLVNHSRRKPNSYMKCMETSDGKVMLILFALKNIKVGQEILYDYGERRKEILALYPWLKM